MKILAYSIVVSSLSLGWAGWQSPPIGVATAAGVALEDGAAPTLLAELCEGKLALACRHAITARRPSTVHFDVNDRRSQRNLSNSGERQARALGNAIRRTNIPIGRVISSPYARTKESAELAFGRTEIDPVLTNTRRTPMKSLLPLLAEPTDGGGNRVLMTHQAVLYRALPQVKRGSIEEGDCIVVRPLGRGRFDTLERVGADRWTELR